MCQRFTGLLAELAGDAGTVSVFSQLSSLDAAPAELLGEHWACDYLRKPWSPGAALGCWSRMSTTMSSLVTFDGPPDSARLDAIWVGRLQETPADAGMRKSTVVPP